MNISGADMNVHSTMLRAICKSKERIRLMNYLIYRLNSTHQFHLHIILRGNDKGTGSRWKSAIEKTECAQLRGVIKVISRIDNVDSLTADERQHQTRNELLDYFRIYRSNQDTHIFTKMSTLGNSRPMPMVLRSEPVPPPTIFRPSRNNAVAEKLCPNTRSTPATISGSPLGNRKPPATPSSVINSSGLKNNDLMVFKTRMQRSPKQRRCLLNCSAGQVSGHSGGLRLTSSRFFMILLISMSTKPTGLRMANEMGAMRYRYEAYSGCTSL